MSGTYPVQASALRVGGYVMINTHPCKIIKMSISRPGKHGHAKVNLTGIDIFANTKHETINAGSHNMDVPNITRTEYQVIDISEDNYLSLLDDKGEPKEDVSLPSDEELADQIKDAFNNLSSDKDLMVTILGAIDKEQVISFKTSN